MKQYTIEQLYGAAWEAAIGNVGEAIGMTRFDAVCRKWVDVEDTARRLKVRFDLNGEII